MKAGLALAAAVLALASCGAIGTRQREAKALATQDLDDPSSVQWRNEKIAVRAGGPPFFCAEMNAKNRLGAYVGFRRVYVDLASKTATFEPEEDNQRITFDTNWSKNCQLGGPRPTT